MLQLLEIAIANFLYGNINELTPEEEENILKAILVLNEKAENKQLENINHEKPSTYLDLYIRYMWPMMLPLNEYTYRKEIIVPLNQAFLLSDFLKNDEDYKPYSENYLKKNKVNSYEEYFQNIVSLYYNGYNKEQKSFYAFYNQESLFHFTILQGLVQTIGETSSKDYQLINNTRFINFKKKPILKTSSGKYFISNWSFIIDKLYEGFKYDFFENSGIKCTLKGDNNSQWNSFTSDLSFKFSEKIVFANTIKKYFLKNNTICLFDNGKKLNQDLYLRNENHVTFIEFKSLNFTIKERFEQIKEVVDERMVFDNKKAKKKAKKKAVFQLIEQIKMFHDNINRFENLSFTRERIMIYPIIVYTDYNWGLYGVNDYLSQIFKKEIYKLDLKFYSIDSLVMIHIDFFVEYEKVFLEDGKNLHQIIHSYEQTKILHKEILEKSIFNGNVTDEKIMGAYANFSFYAGYFLKNRSTPIHQSSLFKDVMTKLGY